MDAERHEGTAPIIASRGHSAAEASRPETTLDERYHTYESNPVPWWLSLVWVSFLVFGALYLVVNLIP